MTAPTASELGIEPVTPTPSFWTVARVIELHRLIQIEHMSAGQAAKLLGCSRNAAISKAGRSGITLGTINTGRANGAASPKPKSRSFDPHRALARLRKLPKAPKPRRVPKPVEIAPTQPVPLMLPLLAITDHTCKFGIGESLPVLFCGAPTIDGSWCPYHRAIVWQPRTPRGDRDAKRLGSAA